MEMEKVTVYAEKYTICTLFGNMRIMPRLHIRIKLACLTGLLYYNSHIVVYNIDGLL